MNCTANWTAVLIVRKDATGEALYSTRTYRPGEVVFEFEPVEWRARRDRFTVEHPAGGHLFHPVLAKVAHGCDPNCRISFREWSMVVIKPIEAGDPITIDYEATESQLAHPFLCLCGSRRCRGRIT
jgi:hypothetical protein